MPKNSLKRAFELNTRGVGIFVDAEIGMTVEGKELPSLAVLGAALEEAQALIQTRVTESFQAVPART